jgi:hypothetical protein
MGLLGSFYDVQGRALLHGHLAVPTGSVSFEGFVIGGRTHVYFGLFPAVLRLPVLLVTHHLDGRLTQLSMLLAFGLLLFCGARLQWRVRAFLGGGETVSKRERYGAFVLSFWLGAGAMPLFLASWPVVYHEAALWGAALSIAALAAILAAAPAPTPKRIGWAGLLSMLAVKSRLSVGLGPVVALVLLGLASLTQAYADSRASDGRVHRTLRAVGSLAPGDPGVARRTGVLLLLAAAVAIAPAILLNELRFDSAFGIPLTKPIDTAIDPVQRAFLAANHGSTVGAQFIPTTLLAALRPDAIGGLRAFPFLGLPAPPTVIGSVRFNALLPTLSAITWMPLFCVLLIAGLPGAFQNRRGRSLLLLVAAGAAAFLPAVSFGSTATRYLADLLPCLFLGACVGFSTLCQRRWLPSRRQARTGLAAVVALALAGTLINYSVGLVQQRLVAPTTSPATRAPFIHTQDSIDRFLGRRPHGIHLGSTLPAHRLGRVGDLFVVGRCAGLYVESFGGAWLPVERSPATGLLRLRVRFAKDSSRAEQALLSFESSGDRTVVTVSRPAPDRARFAVMNGGRLRPAGASTPIDPGR